jgi:hypothetical protein
VPPPQLTKKAAMRGIAVLGHEHLFIWSTAAPAAHPNFFFCFGPVCTDDRNLLYYGSVLFGGFCRCVRARDSPALYISLR